MAPGLVASIVRVRNMMGPMLLPPRSLLDATEEPPSQVDTRQVECGPCDVTQDSTGESRPFKPGQARVQWAPIVRPPVPSGHRGSLADSDR